MIKKANFSPCRKYRYTLTRTWDKNKGIVAFVGLNPSTADENRDDHTITHCINYAKQWGYGGLVMINLFAFKATAPANMKIADDPIGQKNDYWLLKIAKEVDLIIACWGNPGTFLNRGKDVYNLLKNHNMKCLKINETGEPHHPLYLPENSKPIKFEY